MKEIDRLLQRPEFPKSARYDPVWMLENQMGPNVLWLIEWLTDGLTLAPGMRVLDLGCGRALSSIFLAKEFGARVWAADLWIGPDGNWRRVLEAGVGDRVYPLRVEAHALPFPLGFFDAVVSVDAYQYFGTDVLYLGYLSRFVCPGGTLAIVVPGLMQPIHGAVPEHLAKPQSNGKVFWEEECWSFQTASWWRRLWSRTNQVAEVAVDTQPDGWRHWRDFELAVAAAGTSPFPSDAEAIDQDAGRYLGFIRAVARRTEAQAENLYDPAIGVRVGVDT